MARAAMGTNLVEVSEKITKQQQKQVQKKGFYKNTSCPTDLNYEHNYLTKTTQTNTNPIPQRLRLEKWANRKLRHWSRGMMKKRNKAATKIAFAFWKGKQGRFLNHLIEMSQRDDNKHLLVVKNLRDAAATTLQAVTHGVWVRRFIGRTISAIKIQKICRGFLGRGIALAKLRNIQNSVVSSFMERMIKEAKLKEEYRIKKLKKQAATLIQSAARGFKVRLFLERKVSERSERALRKTNILAMDLAKWLQT